LNYRQLNHPQDRRINLKKIEFNRVFGLLVRYKHVVFVFFHGSFLSFDRVEIAFKTKNDHVVDIQRSFSTGYLLLFTDERHVLPV